MKDKQVNKGFIDSLIRYYSTFEDVFLVVCFIIMATALFLQVLFRYLFNYPLTFSEELARYMLVWISFLGINYGLRRKKHIALEYFFNRFPTGLQKFIHLLTNFIILVTIAYFIPGALKFFLSQLQIKSSAMQIPMAMVYISILIGFFLSFITILIQSFRMFVEIVQPKGRG